MSLPLPTVRRGVYTWDSCETTLMADVVQEEEPVPVTGAVYLEAARLDLQDNRAILNFVSRYGLMGVYDSEAERWPFFERDWSLEQELATVERARDSLTTGA